MGADLPPRRGDRLEVAGEVRQHPEGARSEFQGQAEPVGGDAISGQRLEVRGTSFWLASKGGVTSELNAHDYIEVDGQHASWTVKPVLGQVAGPPVESASPRVVGYLRRVVAEKERIARRYRAHRPLAKPVPKRVPRPAGAPVPCPLCRPGADATYPGEAWPDCEVCDGEGVVSAERAAERLAEHG
jgi:hypothetical protein